MESTPAGKPGRGIRVLLPEGSSLSARQAVNALGPFGYELTVCDPNPQCVCRFSRYVRTVHCSPAFGSDPGGYYRFVLELLQRERFDVLLPIHEHAFMFSRYRDELARYTGVSLAEFGSFAALQSKAAFVRLLDRLELPHPETRIVTSRVELEAQALFPSYVKAAYGTAGAGVWRVTDRPSLERTIRALEAGGKLGDGSEVLVQAVAPGVLGVAQSVFDQGELVAAHCYRQMAEGVGGSAAARVGVDLPLVRDHLRLVGRAVRWHGALMLDFLFDPATGEPSYIEANPRPGETMNATLSGVNLTELLVRLSLGERLPAGAEPRYGVRSHGVISVLLGLGDRGAGRMRLVMEASRMLAGRGRYQDSREDVTPVFRDPPSALPLLMVLARLLRDPRSARKIAGRSVADYSLSPEALRVCLEESLVR